MSLQRLKRIRPRHVAFALFGVPAALVATCVTMAAILIASALDFVTYDLGKWLRRRIDAMTPA